MNLEVFMDPIIWVGVVLYVIVILILRKLFPDKFELSQLIKHPGGKGYKVSMMYVVIGFVLAALYGIVKIFLPNF